MTVAEKSWQLQHEYVSVSWFVRRSDSCVDTSCERDYRKQGLLTGTRFFPLLQRVQTADVPGGKAAEEPLTSM
jgi:hypothetical protein